MVARNHSNRTQVVTLGHLHQDTQEHHHQVIRERTQDNQVLILHHHNLPMEIHTTRHRNKVKLHPLIIALVRSFYNILGANFAAFANV